MAGPAFSSVDNGEPLKSLEVLSSDCTLGKSSWQQCVLGPL